MDLQIQGRLRGTVMVSFAQEKAEEPIGQFYEVANEVKNMDNALLDANAIAIQSVQDQLHDLTQQWNPNFDAIAQAQWEASKSSLMEQLASLSAQGEAQVAAQTEAETNALAELALDNQAIYTDKVVEENLRLFNQVYLNGAVKGVDGFSAEELNILRYVADQCPLSGGNAVFYARGQRALVEDVQYDDRALCAAVGIQMRQIPINGIAEGMGWAPNPTSDASVVKFPELTEEGILEIRNSFGNLVLGVNLPRKSVSHSISLSSFTAGLYFTCIRNSHGAILYQSKLQVIN